MSKTVKMRLVVLLNIMPQMLFGGLFMNLNSVPPGFIWLKTISIFRLGFEDRGFSGSRLKDPDGKNACVAPPTVLLGPFVGCFTCNMQLKNGDFQLQHHFSEAFSGFFRCHPVPQSPIFFPHRSSPGTHDQPVARLRRPGLHQ